MLFNQLIFVVFLTAVLLFLLLVRNNRIRKLFLLACSYYFYAYWDWRFCGLLLFSTVLDYWVGQKLKVTDDAGKRKALLLLSIVSHLSLLGFFKYFNFFVHSLQVLAAPLGWNLGTLNIILPVGISFYTFQALTYTIEVYRKNLKPCDDLWDFALFIDFFKQIMAGTIVRAVDLLPQLKESRTISWERFFLGFRQFVYGLVKKVLIADHLAMVSNYVFDNMGVFDGWTTWLGVFCYTAQIYCDFSGYSDMAIGIARAMGYDYNANFDHPYTATSITAFWRKWHISLSTWLRDYLYIPLGGNRKGDMRTYINQILTMLLGGLWHGATWTFVFWGFFHGCALVVDKRFNLYQKLKIAGPLVKGMGWLSTMMVVMIGWVFFRSHSFGDAVTCLYKMFNFMSFNEGVHWISFRAVLLLPVVFFFQALSVTSLKRLVELPAGRWYTPVALFILIYLVLLFQPKDFTPFVYFQF